MSLNQYQFYRRNLLFLVLGATILGALVLATLVLTTTSERQFSTVVAIREVRSAAADLISVVQSAESSQRGFLVTHEPAYLETYSQMAGQYEYAFDRLARSAKALPGQTFDIDALHNLIRAKFTELEDTAALGRAGRFDDAVNRVRDDVGFKLMERISTELGKILDTSERELNEAVSRQTSSVYWLRFLVIAGAVVIATMAAAITWTLVTYLRALSEARAEIELANAGLEQRVKQRTHDLTQANEEIQRFAYIVTHDLRAPLVNIMGFTSELEAMFQPIRDYVGAEKTDTQLRDKAATALSDDIPEAIRFIRSATSKMDGLINAILKISREGRRQLQRQPIHLPDMITTAANAIHHQASAEGGRVSVDLQETSIFTDKLALDQIIGNLLDNAIKFKSPDRPLELNVRSYRGGGNRIVLEVADNGRGIAPADHERIFELFRRSGKQNTPGEGIGLAQVKSLVRNLGGDITVRSEPDKGSVFTLNLPRDLNDIRRSE
jgi:signal transduction histidine kinase